MTPTAPPTDPAVIVANLSGADLRRRLAELDAERSAIVVLLRAVAAKERAEDRQRKAVARAG